MKKISVQDKVNVVKDGKDYGLRTVIAFDNKSRSPIVCIDGKDVIVGEEEITDVKHTFFATRMATLIAFMLAVDFVLVWLLGDTQKTILMGIIPFGSVVGISVIAYVCQKISYARYEKKQKTA